MDEILQYVDGMTLEQFATDSRTIKAVIRSIEVIGEAVKNLPDEIKSQRPEVPWREMARMRDKCIHFYFGVDYEIVWMAATKSIPEVRPIIADLIQKIQDEKL